MAELEQFASHVRAFDSALDTGVGVAAGTFAVGGMRLAVRCVGDAGWDDLIGVLVPTSGSPDLQLDLWDVEASPIELPRGGWPSGMELRDGANREALGTSQDGTWIRYAGPHFDVWLDRRAHHGVGWVAAGRLPPWHRLRPWQRLLVPALADMGVETVHAAMVARAGRGVLLPGSNGAGKSTATFACLEEGFESLGDDAVAVEYASSRPFGHTLHAVAKLSTASLNRFSDLAKFAEPFDDPTQDEQLVRLRQLAPPRATASASIAAIAFPRLAASDRSTIRPLPRSLAAASLLKHALSIEPTRLETVFETLTRIAADTPSFTLEVGRDPHGLADAIDGLLSAS